MRNLQDLSGPWVGFWVQAQRRGEMRLTLRFAQGVLTGEGSDPVGPFTIAGRFDDATKAVSFERRYPSHGIDYSGTWDDAMIAGRWRLKSRFTSRSMRSGEFEIWPERDDQAIERMEAALAASA